MPSCLECGQANCVQCRECGDCPTLCGHFVAPRKFTLADLTYFIERRSHDLGMPPVDTAAARRLAAAVFMARPLIAMARERKRVGDVVIEALNQLDRVVANTTVEDRTVRERIEDIRSFVKGLPEMPYTGQQGRGAFWVTPRPGVRPEQDLILKLVDALRLGGAGTTDACAMVAAILPVVFRGRRGVVDAATVQRYYRIARVGIPLVPREQATVLESLDFYVAAIDGGETVELPVGV